jgi:phosphoribosylformylglycinamidine synthase subunit PurQ / glutaminase
MKIKTLIITGFGLNCEVETKAAFDYCGAESDLVHLNDLLNRKKLLNDYHILAFIGGFSFGDHLGAGTVFANKVKYGLKEDIKNFIADSKLIIGICNGFQTLTRLGLLPCIGGKPFAEQSVALAWNDSGVFRNSWVNLKAEPNCPCVFTKGITTLEVPIRHGEGKFVANSKILAEIENNNLVALRYADSAGIPTNEFPYNPNGSLNNIAGICDPTGKIFGLMPHPEAYLSPYNHPNWIRQKESGTLPKEGAGIAIFRNAVEYIY